MQVKVVLLDLLICLQQDLDYFFVLNRRCNVNCAWD
jgi:hypothetical protein